MSDRPAQATLRAIEPARLAELRRRASMHLTGSATGKNAAARAADALTVLHALASSPDTAADALALLHELQVHQIELDMQAQDLQESRAELESALRRQLVLYDHLPVGSFTIDACLVLHEVNLTGAALLGLGRDEAYGMALDWFFTAESARRFRAALARFDASHHPASCLIKLCSKGGPEREVLAHIGADPAGRGYLVSLSTTAA